MTINPGHYSPDQLRKRKVITPAERQAQDKRESDEKATNDALLKQQKDNQDLKKKLRAQSSTISKLTSSKTTLEEERDSANAQLEEEKRKAIQISQSNKRQRPNVVDEIVPVISSLPITSSQSSEMIDLKIKIANFETESTMKTDFAAATELATKNYFTTFHTEIIRQDDNRHKHEDKWFKLMESMKR